jgi:hypothetical protein
VVVMGLQVKDSYAAEGKQGAMGISRTHDGLGDYEMRAGYEDNDC